MTVPDYQQLMLPVLRSAASGEVTNLECRERVAAELHLTDGDISEMLPSGRQSIFVNRVAWAKSYLTGARLVTPVERGRFALTDRGKELLSSNPSRIDIGVLRQYPDFVAWLVRTPRSDTDSSQQDATLLPPPASEIATPEDRIEGSFALLLRQLQTEVLDRLLSVTPAFFEQVIVDLLVAMGYGGGKVDAGKAIGRSGDGGIDGIIKEDPLGLDAVYVQAKRYARDNVVGRPELQAFAGSLQGVGASKGIFVTTSSFAKPAREYVNRIPTRVVLIDGAELSRLLIDYGVGVRIKATYHLKRLDEDYFLEE